MSDAMLTFDHLDYAGTAADNFADLAKVLDTISATLNGKKYDLIHFFDTLKKKGVENIDPDDILRNVYFNQFESNRNLVERAKKELYPFRGMAEQEAVDFDISDRIKTNENPVAKFAEKTGEKIKQFQKDIKTKFDPIEAAKEAQQEKEDENVEIADTQPNFYTPAQEQAAQVAISAIPAGAIDIDTQEKMDKISTIIKKIVPKDTEITTSYNYGGTYFTVSLQFPDGKTNTVTIDPGTFLPDEYSVMVNDITGGYGPVPLSEDVAKSIINTPMYHLTKEETEYIVKKYFFDNLGLYYVFDFSSLKGLNKLSEKNKEAFNKILTDLAESLRDKATSEIPRFRFTEFNWIDDFVLVSDNKCKMPLAYVGEQSAWIVNQKVIVKEGKADIIEAIN